MPANTGVYIRLICNRTIFSLNNYVPYSRKGRRGIIVGGLTVGFFFKVKSVKCTLDCIEQSCYRQILTSTF